MSGKFWGTDSEEEEEEEDFYSDSEEGEDEVDNTKNAGAWVKGADIGDDFEDERREVKSKHEKMNDQLQEKVETIKKAMGENDWNTISKEFEELNKIHPKWLTAWERNKKDPAPLYLSIVVDLEQLHSKCYSDNKYKKTLSNTNKKSLNQMKQKITRVKGPYKSQLAAFVERKKKVESGELDASELLEKVVHKKDLLAQQHKEEANNNNKKKGKKGGKKNKGMVQSSSNDDEEEWTVESVDERLTEIISSRGKKGYDRASQLVKLKELVLNAQNIFQTVQINLHIISIQLDGSSVASHIGPKVWNEVLTSVGTLLKLVEENPAVLKAKNTVESQTPTIEVKSTIFRFLERLESEFYKSLQDIDSQKVKSFVKRMRDVTSLLQLTEQVSTVYTSWGVKEAIVKTALIQMKYRHVGVRLNERNGEENKVGDFICEGMVSCSPSVMEEYAKRCFVHGDERQKAHAILYYIIYLSNHGDYANSRSLMLMSHLQDTISSADIDTQILFNRAMASLGLSAFREGNISDCHNCLVDLYSNMKFKELLGQGTTRYGSEKAPEQEKIESRRLIPYHMHINTEILETAYFVSAILLEVPNSAASAHDQKRKPISKILKKYLEQSGRQVFCGPPEAPRDSFVAAAKALIGGDWKKCCDLVFGLEVWEYISDSKKLKEDITSQIKEQGLRTYLLKASSTYESVCTERLASLFGLEEKKIRGIVSRMIVNNEIIASWDKESNCILLHREDPSRVQSLSLQFAEKTDSLVENNERLLEIKNYYKSSDGQRKSNYRTNNSKRNNQK